MVLDRSALDASHRMRYVYNKTVAGFKNGHNLTYRVQLPVYSMPAIRREGLSLVSWSSNGMSQTGSVVTLYTQYLSLIISCQISLFFQGLLIGRFLKS